MFREAVFCEKFAKYRCTALIGTCYGDSGGPAIRRVFDEQDGTERFTLVGVVSGNAAGCVDNRQYPDYFTFIGHQKVGDGFQFQF